MLEHNDTQYNGTYVVTCSRNPLCLSTDIQVIMIMLNFFSFVLNLFHLIILTSISSLKRSPFMTSMKAIALTDMLYSLSLMLSLSCNLREVSRKSYALSAVLSGQMAFAMFLRYFYLATAMVERLISTCRYSSGETLKQLHWVFFGEAIIIATLVTTKESLYYEHICYSTIIGPVNITHPVTHLICLIGLCIPVSITVVTVPVLLFQLRHLSNNSVTNNMKSMVAATKYVIIIGLAFLLLPFTLVLVIVYKGRWNDIYNIVVFTAQSLYGIVNTLTYGLMSKVYRRHLARIANRMFNSSP